MQIIFFFRTAVLRKLFEIRFSYKHCNFWRVCLLFKMASKTVTRSINSFVSVESSAPFRPMRAELQLISKFVVSGCAFCKLQRNQLGFSDPSIILADVLGNTCLLVIGAFCISQFQLHPVPPPGLLRGICPPYQSRGRGCPGAGHLPTPGLFPSFSHARGFLSEYITTQRILPGKKAKWLICQGQGVVKACSWFYACISSLLIKPELRTATSGAIEVILFEKHPFIFAFEVRERNP